MQEGMERGREGGVEIADVEVVDIGRVSTGPATVSERS